MALQKDKAPAKGSKGKAAKAGLKQAFINIYYKYTFLPLILILYLIYNY